MSLAFAFFAFGAMLIYAGWTNRSVWALASGDDSVKNAAAGSSSPAATSAGSNATGSTIVAPATGG